jgi:hypothetical protein
MQNCPFRDDLPISKLVIFYSYVRLPEGKFEFRWVRLFANHFLEAQISILCVFRLEEIFILADPYQNQMLIRLP